MRITLYLDWSILTNKLSKNVLAESGRQRIQTKLIFISNKESKRKKQKVNTLELHRGLKLRRGAVRGARPSARHGRRLAPCERRRMLRVAKLWHEEWGPDEARRRKSGHGGEASEGKDGR